MHACLNVDEIVRLIACELVVSEAKATAVSLACCHKAFEDPILDALWETQDELLPLLKSLPGDVWNEGECTSFKRLPTALEWARFRNYSRRIQKLQQSKVPDHLSLEVFPVLQLRSIDKPLFPNLETLYVWDAGRSIPFIPLFLSPRTTVISIQDLRSDLPNAVVASTVASFPTLCPNLQEITLQFLPSGPMITAAVSGMLLSSNRDALRRLRVGSPLTEEACQVISNLPNLRDLWVVIEKGASSPPAVLPNLIDLTVKYDHDSDVLRMFHGAAFGKLETITFRSGSEQIGDFLEAFERVAITASVQKTLSELRLYTSQSWHPNYSSLLPFTQLTTLDIQCSCEDGCSSSVNDDVIMNLARAMPKLQTLELGGPPCHDISTGVTSKGLVVLAHHCPNLFTLSVHLQVDSLCVPRAISGVIPDTGSTAPRRDCALKDLDVGEIPLSEESVPTVALTLAHIFPHIEWIHCFDDNWVKVVDAIRNSREIINRSIELRTRGGRSYAEHRQQAIAVYNDQPRGGMLIGGFRFFYTSPLVANKASDSDQLEALSNNVGTDHPMHVCLNVDEIVRLIACELAASKAKATAVALASCCKSLEDPVLDALWETQSKLRPLLESLPGNVWNEGGCTSFKRLPTTLEWARFRKYARRMRTCSVSYGGSALSPEVSSLLQLYAIDEPLFPNLKALDLWNTGESISFVPLFLSPRITSISIRSFGNLPITMVASIIITLPKVCPNLQEINLHYLPRDLMIAAAVSTMIQASDRHALQCIRVDSPLTEVTHQAIYNLPNLRVLDVVIEKDSPLLVVVLPNLTELAIEYNHNHSWLHGFRGATLGKLASVTFRPECESIDGLLEVFERVALSASVQDTLSEFYLYTSHSWNPNYSSLLSFTQLKHLVIDFSCDDGCSSTVDDDVIMDLARAMPKLETLRLGDEPCQEIQTGVTVKGLMVLAHHCLGLYALRIHFKADSLGAPPVIPAVTPNTGSTTLRGSCALTDLEVGRIPVPEGSASTVALTLVRIFPRLANIDHIDDDWDEVVDEIRVSAAIVDYSRTILGNAI